MFSGQPEDLIKKFAPILLFDKSEQNLPSSTDWYSQQVGYQSGSTYYEPGTWSWSNPASQATDYLVPPESVASQIEPGNVDTFVSYVHLLPVTGHSDEVDIQYWFFYPFNGTVTFDIDAMLGDVHGAMPLSQHWADWECVIVRVNTQQQVIAVFFAQHSEGEWCTPGDGLLSLVNQQPKVYVAQGSHASYPISGGPFEIGGVDIMGSRWSETDYADGGGIQVDLSKPGPAGLNRLVLVANDAASYFSAPPAVVPPGWINFQGLWGPPLFPGLSSEMIAKAFLGALETASWVGVLHVILGPIGLSAAALEALGAFLVQTFYSVEQTAPGTPSVRKSWSSTMEYLPFGDDLKITPSLIAPNFSRMPVALVALSSGTVLCLANSGPSNISVGALTAGKWSAWPKLSASASSGIAAVGTGSGTGVALVALVDGKLAAWTSSNPATVAWQPVSGWTGPAAVGGAAITQLGSDFVIAYGGTDGNLYTVKTVDWQTFTAPQIATSLSSGKSSAVATPISFVINASASPALAAMNGTLVAVIPINAPAPDLPVSLAAYTSTDGATWDGPFLIGEMPTYKNGGAGAATGPDGQIYVMFGDADKNRVRISSSEDAVAWSDPGVLKGAYTSIQPSLTFTGETLVCAHPGNKSAFVWWNEATP